METLFKAENVDRILTTMAINDPRYQQLNTIWNGYRVFQGFRSTRLSREEEVKLALVTGVADWVKKNPKATQKETAAEIQRLILLIAMQQQQKQ